MALLTAERIDRPPLSLFGEVAALEDGVSGGPTLDDLIVGAWEGLAAHAAVSCPLCDGVLACPHGAGSMTVGGHCEDCGTTLS